MKRRDFVKVAAATAAVPALRSRDAIAQTGPGYASPAEAMRGPREKLLYTVAIYTGTEIDAPDYLATIDADPSSSTYSQVIHRLPMPNPGDELHHFGWNACSSCHGDPTAKRRYMIVPGLKSSRIQIIDNENPRAPKIIKVIEPEEIKSKTNLSAPHTVHCLADGTVMISMLGDDGEGNASGRLPACSTGAVQRRRVGGRSDATARCEFNYDFWYQPRHDVMVSSEFGAPGTYLRRLRSRPTSQAGKYGRRTSLLELVEADADRQSIDLGDEGLIPLEIRFHHDPASAHGYVGAALSSTMWHLHPGTATHVAGRQGHRRRVRSSRRAGRSRCPGSSPTSWSRWTTATSTSPTGCTATSASTTSPIPEPRGWSGRSGAAA